MKSKKHDLPQKVYVFRAQDGNDSYLIAYPTLDECGSPEEKRLVGYYELKTVGEVTMEVAVAWEGDEA